MIYTTVSANQEGSFSVATTKKFLLPLSASHCFTPFHVTLLEVTFFLKAFFSNSLLKSSFCLTLIFITTTSLPTCLVSFNCLVRTACVGIKVHYVPSSLPMFSSCNLQISSVTSNTKPYLSHCYTSKLCAWLSLKYLIVSAMVHWIGLLFEWNIMLSWRDCCGTQ